MENLPTDIIEYILSRLPIESTLQSRPVCKTWRNLIGDKKTGVLFSYADLNELPAESTPDLNELPAKSKKEVQLYYGDQSEANLEQYYSNKTLEKLDRLKFRLRVKYLFDHNHMVGSCNRLVCLHSYNSHRCRICNPVTGELLVLKCLRKPKWIWQVVGFGYLPSTNEYKVVRCSYGIENGVRQGHVEVYTLGSQSGWRAKEYIPYCLKSSGIFANGAIHWDGLSRILVYKIVAFDLVDEKMKYVSSPFDYANGGSLVLLGGNLCVVRHIGDEILVWAFKKRTERILRPRVTGEEEYYDRTWSWSKEFSISISDPERNRYWPFAITKSNEILLWQDKKLYCYDNNTSTLTKLWEDDGKGYSCLQAIPHMNTLVSLKDLRECCAEKGTSVNDSGHSKRRKCKRHAG